MPRELRDVVKPNGRIKKCGVERITVEECSTTRRKWVVAFRAGDVFECREAGRQKRYSAPLGRICLMVAKANIDAERVLAKKARKAGRLMR
jgi:hypothetical protein